MRLWSPSAAIPHSFRPLSVPSRSTRLVYGVAEAAAGVYYFFTTFEERAHQRGTRGGGLSHVYRRPTPQSIPTQAWSSSLQLRRQHRGCGRLRASACGGRARSSLCVAPGRLCSMAHHNNMWRGCSDHAGNEAFAWPLVQPDHGDWRCAHQYSRSLIAICGTSSFHVSMPYS